MNILDGAGVGWFSTLIGIAFIVVTGWTAVTDPTFTAPDVLVGCAIGGGLAIVGWLLVAAARTRRDDLR